MRRTRTASVGGLTTVEAAPFLSTSTPARQGGGSSSRFSSNNILKSCGDTTDEEGGVKLRVKVTGDLADKDKKQATARKKKRRKSQTGTPVGPVRRSVIDLLNFKAKCVLPYF